MSNCHFVCFFISWKQTVSTWISSTYSLIASLNELMCVSKVRPAEKSGQEPRPPPAGGSPGQERLLTAVPGARSLPWARPRESARRAEMLLRAEMEVSAVLAVAGASSAINIDLHSGFKITKTKICCCCCSFHLPDDDEQQLPAPFTAMPPSPSLRAGNWRETSPPRVA